MGGPTLQDYREMLSPGLKDLIAEVLEPEGFVGRELVLRRDDAGVRHELRFAISRNSPMVRTGALMHLTVAIQPRLAVTEHERLVPGEHCEIRMPVELVECAMHQRRTTWAFDSAEAAEDLVPSVRRTLVGAVLPYLEPRRAAERLLAAVAAAVMADEPPSDYQPHSGTAAVAAALALVLGRVADARRLLVTAYADDEYLRREYAHALSVVGVEG
jgi:hypothetical protein